MSRRFATALASCADAAGVRIGPEACRQLEGYYDLLRRWNEKISLTSLPLDGFPSESMNRLLIEPAIAAQLIPSGAVRLLDVGSGGGSPAIPLKILRPGLLLTMTEARQKKVTFLREAASALGLDQVNVLDGRLEERRWEEPFDWVTLRAVRVDRALVEVVHKLLTPAGRLLLFGAPEQNGDLGLREVERLPLPGGSALLVLAKGV